MRVSVAAKFCFEQMVDDVIPGGIYFARKLTCDYGRLHVDSLLGNDGDKTNLHSLF